MQTRLRGSAILAYGGAKGGVFLLRRTLAIPVCILLFSLCLGCATDKVATKQRARALEDLGISYVRQGKLRDGLEKLLEASKLDPENAAIHHKVALVYRDLGEYELSLEHFKKALALRPRYPEAQNNLGTLYMLMRKWDLAIESFQKAVADILYKTPHYAYHNMGLAYFNQGNYEKARAHLNGALDLVFSLKDHELSSRTHTALGNLELELGHVSEAHELSLKAISGARLCRNQVLIAEGLHLLASSEMSAAQLTEAASHFNEALDLDKTENYLSGQGSCLANLALVEQRLGELDRARRHQEEALETFLKIEDEKYAAAAENNLGYLYDVTGVWGKALKHYTGALTRYKEVGNNRWIAVCHLNIGSLQIRMGEDKEGVRNIEHALELSRLGDYRQPCIEAYGALSVALANRREFKKALEKIGQAERMACEKGLSPADPLLQMSEIYLMLNDRNAAIRAYEKAANLPEFDPYIKARTLRLKAQLFPEGASENIPETISIFHKLNDRFELAKTLLVEAGLYADGKLATSEGRPIDAGVVTAEDALDIFRSLGAEPYVSMSTRQIAEYKKKARETTDTENTYLKTIFAVNKMMDLLTDQENMLDHVLDRVIDILGAERGMVLLLDEEGDLIPAAGRKIDKQSERDITQISRTVVRNVATTRRPATSANASNDPHYMTLSSITLHGIKSLMCVPLINRGEAIGVLYVDHTAMRNLFTPYDDEFLMTVGNLLAASIDKSRYINTLETENVELKRLLHESFSSKNIIGTSPQMSRVRKLVLKYALADRNVLIIGESGTGKGLIARALHFESARKHRPFVTLDSAHIPAQLIEGTLFGHIKGAFSGAYSDSQGLIESANGGTLFLDNVDSIPLDTQAKLVRPLQSGAVRRLGSTRTKSIHFRIISATSIPLEHLVEKGQFRLDLYLTLKILEIAVPSLRKRGTDVHELASYFLDVFAVRARKRIGGFSKEALDSLSAHLWAGNVTELEKCIERAVALCRGELISAGEIGLTIPKVSRPSPTLESSRGFAELSELSSAMLQSGGNVTRAAESLSISRRQVQRLLKKHSLLASQFKPVTAKKTTYTHTTPNRPTAHKTKRRKGLSS